MDIEQAKENNYIQTKDLDRYLKNKKEIGDQAVWSLNSAKQGNGIYQLRDDNLETFWQSDGPIPHLINIQFHKKTKVTDIAVYLDFQTDESYTPQVLSIKAGNYMQEMKEIVKINLKEPKSWIVIPLKYRNNTGKNIDHFYAINYQIEIQQMFHQGKDTHVRLVKIFTNCEKKQNVQKNNSMNYEAFQINELR